MNAVRMQCPYIFLIKCFNFIDDALFLLCFCVQPKIVEALLGYELVQVSCGASHVLAVTNEREVFAWGRGDNGIVNKPVY